MLEIRTFRSKSKGIRVDVYRKYKPVDKATGKTVFNYKQLGSFSLVKGCASEILTLLQPAEIVQLKNWLAEARFAEIFETPADGLTKFTFRMPQKVYEAFTRLYFEAKRARYRLYPLSGYAGIVTAQSKINTA